MAFLIGSIFGLLSGSILVIAVVRKLGKAARRSIFWEGVLRSFCALGAPRVYSVVADPEKPKAEEKPEEAKIDHEKALANVFKEMGFDASETRGAIEHVKLTCADGDTLEHRIFEGLTWLGNRKIAVRPSGLVVAKY